jgi:hypothetical protein
VTSFSLRAREARGHAAALILGSLTMSFAACAGARGGAGGGRPAGGPGADETFTVRVREDAVAVARDLPVSADEAWAAVPGAFADLGYQGGPSTEKGERLYLTPPLKIRGRLYPDAPNSAFVDCGRAGPGGPAADEYSVTFAVLARVTARPDGGSTVRVTVDGVARERTGSSTVVYCAGTGRLEQLFAQAVERRVQQARAAHRDD